MLRRVIRVAGRGPCTPLRLWSCIRVLPSALLHGCCTRAWLAVGEPILILSFTCKCPLLRSGAEGIRPPDLRRAKAARHFSEPFRSLQNSCKQAHFCSIAFPGISGDLLGLLHGCCT